MIHILIGAVTTAALIRIIQSTAKRKLAVKWWQWLLTVLCFVYLVFVLEVVVSFLREGSPKAAMVNGAILGFVAVVWAVLLARFIFTRRLAKE